MTEREREHLTQTDRHIVELKAYIAQERKLIETAIQKGHCTEVAEAMLRALKASLRASEIHRQLIIDRLMSESR
jgi:hypothetical protein